MKHETPSHRRMKLLSIMYVLLGIVYLLLFIWFGFPYVTSLQLSTLGPWDPSGAAYLLFYGFAFLVLAGLFFCQLTAYGFFTYRDWARKLGIVISLPPAIGTLPSALFVMEIMSNWDYYDKVGINPSSTVSLWAFALIVGLINSTLVYFLLSEHNLQK